MNSKLLDANNIMSETKSTDDRLCLHRESSLYAHCVAKDPSFLHAHSEDSDQTGQMPRLI